MKQILPGIVRVYVCECADVPEDADLMGVANGLRPVIMDAEEQPIYGLGELSVETDRDGALGYATATLTYRSSVDMGRTRGLCYCVRAVDDTDYLIGSAERGVRVASVRRFGTPGGDASCFEHTVTYTGLKALQECLIVG